MNDDFLYALRREPSPDFSRKLKRQLQQQVARRANRSSMVRKLLTLFLIGSSALAGAFLAMNPRSNDGAETASTPPGVAERSPATLNMPQSYGPAPTIAAGEGAADVGENSFASQRDSTASAQPPEIPSAAPSGDQQAPGGTIHGGSTVAAGGSWNKKAAPSPAVITSSLIHPLAKTVVDAVSRGAVVKTPIDIRTEDAKAAFRALCSTASLQRFDIVLATRRMAEDEREQCRRGGMPGVVEFKIGYQAVVLTSGTTSAPIKLTTGSVYLALAEQVPDPAQPASLISNPYRSWDQIEQTLDVRVIEVLGPARDKSLRRAFEMLVLGPGCDTRAGIQTPQDADPDHYAESCYSVRADRAYREVEQSVTMLSQNLWADPHAIAVVDYNFYRAQRADLAGSALAGVEPTDSTLADGTYPLARPIYVYALASKVRNERASLGGRLFSEFIASGSANPWGYLLRNGVTPIDERERKTQYEQQQIPMYGM